MLETAVQENTDDLMRDRKSFFLLLGKKKKIGSAKQITVLHALLANWDG